MPGRSTQKSSYQVPITNPLSPALHYLPFASRFPLPHFTLVVLFALSFLVASFRSLFPRHVRTKKSWGSLLSSIALDNPAILSKLINRNAIEQLAGVINENLSNFDEDDSGIFRYLLDESLKDVGIDY